MEFEEYYDLVCEVLKQKGETKTPDRDTARADYRNGDSPEESAEWFLVEWNEI